MDPLKRKEIFVHGRPTNSGVEEPRKYLPRPALQIKRYSSPPGTLQGFEQYIKEHPSDR